MRPRSCVGVRRVSFTKLAVASLEIFTSGLANQLFEGADDLPETWPPTRAVRTKRAFRSAPVVLVRGVRMPAHAETSASIFIEHSLRILPVDKSGEAGKQLKMGRLQMMPGHPFAEGCRFQVPAAAGVVFTWAEVTSPGGPSTSS
jgi:hypothetical protein